MDQEIKKILNDKLTGEGDMLTNEEQQQLWNKLDEKLGKATHKIIPWWQLAAAACVGLLIGLTIMKFSVTGTSDKKYIVATNTKTIVDTLYVDKSLNNTIAVNAANKNHYMRNKPDSAALAPVHEANKDVLSTTEIPDEVAIENKTNTSSNTYTENNTVSTVHLLDIDDADITSLTQNKKKNTLHIPIAFFQNPVNAQRQRDDADEPPTIVKGFSKN